MIELRVVRAEPVTMKQLKDQAEDGRLLLMQALNRSLGYRDVGTVLTMHGTLPV
jgi:hypothetical protein